MVHDSPHQNAIRNSFRRVGSLFRHVHTGVKTTDRPNRTKPAQKPSPSNRPRREISGRPEDEFAVVPLTRSSDGQSNNGCKNKYEVGAAT